MVQPISAHTGGSDNMKSPDWFEKGNYAYNNYTYSVLDLMDSSVSGYLGHGFNYNATDSIANTLTSANFDGDLSSVETLRPNTPGVYNIPVCQLQDLGSVPQCLLAGTLHTGTGFPCQIQSCPCMTDAANITVNGQTQYFRDFAGKGITDAITATDGYSDGSCLFGPESNFRG